MPAAAEKVESAAKPLEKIILPGQSPEGRHIFGVLIKRSYDIVPGGRCRRSAKDAKLIPGDVPYDGPANSAVKFESDFVPFKLATDVVVHAQAHAPGGKAVTSLTASVIVGQQRKDILVIGDRVARHRAGKAPVFTDPVPFVKMEIGYDRAYGGIDVYSNPKMAAMYGRNHVGRGYVISNTAKVVDNLALPNVEDPKDVLTPERLCVGHFKDWERQPMPQGFGWYMKAWRPRSLLAGVMPADKATEKELRAAYGTLVPPAQKAVWEQTQVRDMDFHFFSGASPGLALPFLKGEERIRLVNLDARGEMEFQLPGERPEISLDFGESPQSPPVVLHTVMIHVEQQKLDLVWRGAVPYPGPDWLPKMRKLALVVR